MNLSKYLYILLIIILLTIFHKVLSQIKSNSLVVKNAIIAHRGMPRHAPEETAPSYWLAKKLGADYLEADLQRTKDGVIICLHDDNLKRTTNIETIYPNRANDPVSTFTLDELKKLDAGNWFNVQFPQYARDSYKGLSILTLEELIDIAEANNNLIGLYLETKKPELFPSIEEELYTLLNERGWVDNPTKKLILQTFSSTSLKLLNQYFPNTPTCMLIWDNEEFLKGGVTPDKLKMALEFGIENDAKIIGPSFKGEMNDYHNLLEDWMVEMYRDMGYIVHAYTFDSNNDITNFVKVSDGQFTNRADLLLDFYNQDHKSVEEILSNLNY
jgi:glycerophosphoryl diester phosphodiesterase